MKYIRYKKYILTTFASVLFTLITANHAFAVAPANTTITNTATLTFTAGVTTSSVNASVDINVLLLSAIPTVVAAPAVTVGESQTGTLVYKVTSNANGPETITFGTNAISGSVVGSAAPSVPLSITLGATAASVAGAGSTITVPSDGVADAIPSVNGIENGDSVVIAGVVYSVALVTDNASGTSTIQLTTALAAPIAVGDLILERKDITVTQTVGTVISPATSGTETVTLTAITTAGSGNNTGVINVLKLQFIKMVSVNGSAFTTTAQDASQGDTVTYRMLVIVPAGVTFGTTTITDSTPEFTTYVASSTTMDVDGPSDPANGSAAMADILGVSPLVAGTLINSAGALAGDVTGGVAGTEVSVEFQVTVD